MICEIFKILLTYQMKLIIIQQKTYQNIQKNNDKICKNKNTHKINQYITFWV